ncbi:MAG: sugar-transfer associated ATP-grasp domain-containing protein [Alphaproteobacteria bacterium]
MVSLRFLADIHRAARGRRDAKGVLRQWFEMAALFAVRGNGPGYYQMAGLWRRGRSWAEISGHWSMARYESELARLNPPGYRKISQHKIAEKAVLTLMRIPTPRYIGVLDTACGRDAEGNVLRDADDLTRLFEREGARRVCFKLVEGWSGKGFAAVEVIRGAGAPRFRPLNDQRELTAAELLAHLDYAPGRPRLLEEYLDQHPALASFNPSSVNTLRLWVLRRGDTAETRLGYLRIGRQGSMVDNHGAGGIVAPVDLATARLIAAHDGLMERRVFPVHPDHGAPIAGIELPHFRAAMELAEQCLVAFPNMNFAGVDVAMAVDGPRVIELNARPDREAAGYVGMTTRDVFLSGPPPQPS